MARLPDIDSLGARPIPQRRTQIASVRNAGAVGEAISGKGGLGTVALDMAEQQMEREDKLSYAAAKTAILKADTTAREELQDDPDYGTYEKRYTEKMTQARSQAASLIKSKFDRRLFEVDTQLDLERGSAEVRKLARDKRVGFELGTLQTGLDDLRGVALSAQDDATREQAIRTAREMIGGGVQKGLLDPLKAAEMKRNWGAGYAAVQVSAAIDRGDMTAARATLQRLQPFLSDEAIIRFNGEMDKLEDEGAVLNDVDSILGGAQAGPVNDPVGLVKSLFPGVRVTSTARDPNSRLGKANPRSWHNVGQAIDVAPIPGVTFEQFVGKLRESGLNIIEAKDEVKNPSKHATGPHWHVAYSKAQAKAPQNLEQAIAEFRRRRPDATPDQIKAARAEMATRFQVARQAEKDREDNAVEAAQAMMVKNGGSWFGLPASVRAAVPAEFHPGMINFGEGLKVGSTTVKTDPVAYVELSELAARDPKAFSKINPISYRNRLDDSDWERLVGLRNDIISDGAKGKVYVSDKAIMDATGERLSAAGILTGNSKEAQKNAPRVMAYQRHMRNWAQAFEQRNGRPPNEAEIQRKADMALIETRFDGQENDQSFAFETPDIGRAKIVVPAAIADRIRKEAGRDLSDQDVIAVYIHFRGVKW